MLDLHTYTFNTTLIAMSPEVKERIQNGHRNEEKWSRIHEVLKCEAGNPKNFATGLGFTLQDGLTYYQRHGKNRLCLPRVMEKEIFQNAHDKNTQRVPQDLRVDPGDPLLSPIG